MERVVLFLLSQVIFGILERPLEDDLYFSAYSLWEHGKILWQDGEAVGFYTVKKKGNVFGNTLVVFLEICGGFIKMFHLLFLCFF